MHSATTRPLQFFCHFCNLVCSNYCGAMTISWKIYSWFVRHIVHGVYRIYQHFFKHLHLGINDGDHDALFPSRLTQANLPNALADKRVNSSGCWLCKHTPSRGVGKIFPGVAKDFPGGGSKMVNSMKKKVQARRKWLPKQPPQFDKNKQTSSTLL